MEHLVDVVEDVVVQVDAAARQVGVDREAPEPARSVDVVEVVVAELVPHEGPVRPGVGHPDVPGLQGDALELAVLDDVVVPLVADSLVRQVVDPAVGDAVADPLEPEGAVVGAVHAAGAVYVVVDRPVVPGSEICAVSAPQLDAGPGYLVEVAAADGVSGAADDDGDAGAEVADRAAGDLVAAAAADDHRPVVGRLEGDPPHQHMARLLHDEHRFGQLRKEDLGPGRVGGRPEVEDAAAAVEVPFPGLVQLFEDIEEVEALPLAVAVPVVGLLRPDLPLPEVELLDAVVLVAPVVHPVPVHPQVAGLRPAFGAVVVVGEAAVMAVPLGLDEGPTLGNGADLQPLPGRVAGQRHVAGVADQLGAGAADRGRHAEVGCACGPQVGLQDVGPGLRPQPFEDAAVGHGLPPGKPHPAGEADLPGARLRLPDDGGLVCSGVFLPLKQQGFGDPVGAASQVDDRRPGGRCFRAPRPQGVAGRGRGGEGSLAGAGVGVAAVRSDEQLDRLHAADLQDQEGDDGGEKGAPSIPPGR